jgi:hypothetical protein
MFKRILNLSFINFESLPAVDREENLRTIRILKDEELTDKIRTQKHILSSEWTIDDLEYYNLLMAEKTARSVQLRLDKSASYIFRSS